jgi:hypothetical protein
MMPGTYPLTLYRGDSYAWRFTLWDDDAMSVPIDLTGATVAAEIRDKPSGTTIVSMLCTVTTPNIIDVELVADDSENVPLKGAWDLEVTFPDGQVHTMVAGPVTVTADVTNSTATSTLRLRTA